MPECTVVICKNDNRKVNLKDHGISYHRFPKDPNIKEQWIDATGKPPDWFPGKHSTICSIHFEAEMFKNSKKRRRLFEWAVPKLKLRHLFTSDININKLDVLSMTAGSAGSNSPLSAYKNPSESLSETSRERKMRLEIRRSELKIEKQKRIIKVLQQRTSRYRKKTSSLTKVIRDIKGNNFISSNETAHRLTDYIIHCWLRSARLSENFEMK